MSEISSTNRTVFPCFEKTLRRVIFAGSTRRVLVDNHDVINREVRAVVDVIKLNIGEAFQLSVECHQNRFLGMRLGGAVKKRVLSEMSTFRISSMKNDCSTPLKIE